MVGRQWNRAAIALGSNLGDSWQILNSALEAIARSHKITLRAKSHFYQTLALGPVQPDYLNACALIETSLSPQALLNTLLTIEQQFGRVRQERWGPRLLDLDLLLFNESVIEVPQLQIPHPRLTERAFVLVPLAEIAADWVDPISGKTIAELVAIIDCSGVKRRFER